MTRIRLSGLPVRKPGTNEEEIDRCIAMFSAVKNAALRCRLLQWYVRCLLGPRPKVRGRLGNPNTRREQTLADWNVFDAVEDVLIQGRAKSIADACAVLAEDRGLKGKAPENGLRKAYYRHTHSIFYPASSHRSGTARKGKGQSET